MTTTGPAAIPPQAITAAAEAIDNFPRRVPAARWDDYLQILAKAILEAAAPHLGDGWDAARDRITEANEARRDERERCAQLAEREHVMYTHSPHGPGCPGHRRPFADLLRQGREGGTDG